MKNKPTSPSRFKSKFKLNFFAFILGVLFTSIFFFFYKKGKSTETTVNIPAVKLAAKIATKHLTNPLISSNDYKGYNLRTIENLNDVVEKEIDGLIRSGKANTVSVYFKDLSNNEFFGINEQEIFSPASLMKVPIMIAILKYAEENPSILQEQLTYKGRQQDKFNDQHTKYTASTSLILNLSYPIDELIGIMIEESDNEATILLLDYMVERRPGLIESVESELGLVIPSEAKNTEEFLSVRRYSSFFRVLYNASYLSEDMSNKALDYLTNTGYGNGIRQAIPLSINVAHKFGHKVIDKTNHQLHHFGIVYYKQKPFLIGIMTKGNSEADLKIVIAKIALRVYQEIEKQSKVKQTYLERDIS